MAACFLAMNEIFGRFFNVDPIELVEPLLRRPTVLHPISSFWTTSYTSFRNSRRNTGQGCAPSPGLPNGSNSQGLPDELGRVNFPWNPALVGLPNVDETSS
jgi:hypothetical protein